MAITSTIKIYDNSGKKEVKFHKYSSLHINQSIHGHHSFEVLLPSSDAYDTLQEVAHLIGNKIQFEINGGKQLIGVITTVNFQTNIDHSNSLHLIGYGATILLENGICCQSFSEKTLSQIVEDVKEEKGEQLLNHLTSSSDFIIQDNAQTKLDYSVQYKETPFDYISRLADTYNKWFFFDGVKLYFTDELSDGMPIQLNLGESENLLSIDVQLRLSAPELSYFSSNYKEKEKQFYNGKVTSDDVGNVDRLTQKALDESKSRFKINAMMPSEMSFESEEKLNDWTKEKFKSHISGIVKFIGSSEKPNLKVGSIIRVSSKRKNLKSIINEHGEYRIIKLSHFSSDEGHYSNSFEAIPKEMAVPPKNPYVTFPNCEPQSAFIIDNNDDDGLGRVKVQFQWQKEEETSPWIRLTSPYTNQDDGVYFIPEIGEEVMVDFEYDNPDLPYVTGNLFNGKYPPKYFDSDNKFKVISTKGGNEIYISDEDGAEEISIRNRENDCSITLIMKDKKIVIDANEVEINSNGNMKIESKGDMEIKAAGNMEISTSGNMDVKASGKTAIKGTMIDLN